MNRCADHISHYRLDAENFDYFCSLDSGEMAYEQLFRKFITNLAGRRNSVLDLGSGSGWTAAIPHERLFHVDLSQKNLSRLKSDSSLPIVADAQQLPFRNGTMESIVACEILEHLNEPAKAASEIWRLLAPGGKAIVSTPYKEKIRYSLCIHCNKVTPMNAHLHSFDRSSLLSLFPLGAKTILLFGSKVLVLLRIPRWFAGLPLWIWRALDLPLSTLTDKSQHVILILEKSLQEKT